MNPPFHGKRSAAQRVSDDFHSALADVQQRPCDPIRPLGSFPRPDYLDLFVMTADLVPATPHRWAVTMFEKEAGLAGQIIWRLLLGMRLARKGTADHIAGWSIDASGDDWIRLTAHGPLMSGNLIVRIEDKHVWLATAVRYNRRFGGWLWTLASIAHRMSAPSLLRDSLSRLEGTLNHLDAADLNP